MYHFPATCCSHQHVSVENVDCVTVSSSRDGSPMGRLCSFKVAHQASFLDGQGRDFRYQSLKSV